MVCKNSGFFTIRIRRKTNSSRYRFSMIQILPRYRSRLYRYISTRAQGRSSPSSARAPQLRVDAVVALVEVAYYGSNGRPSGWSFYGTKLSLTLQNRGRIACTKWLLYSLTNFQSVTNFELEKIWFIQLTKNQRVLGTPSTLQV